jgi:diaminohydroxyphosphoribosylaminopyrimidine deaminase/5-amino-6-(5-phosphoribosylamino)uracil reductase
VDGKLADDDDCSQWISGSKERLYTHSLRSLHDAVLVGAQTFLKDRCLLTVRSVLCPGPQPVRIIADPKGRLADEFCKSGNPFQNDSSLSLRCTYIVTSVMPDQEVIQMATGIVWVYAPPSETLESWLRVALIAAFLREGLADRAEVAVSPLILGGKKNRVFTDMRLAPGGSQSSRLSLESVEELDGDVLLKYRVK